jgi:DNA helicase-2/ATP-dependent DNA helicase PcrA
LPEKQKKKTSTKRSKRKPSNVDFLLATLNDAQRAAVMHTEGPVLVLAGAGSGKTRVLTYRIAYLVHTGIVRPGQLIAMTFTNKAAGEMRDRVTYLIPQSLQGLWVGTFHSLFARILRREAERLGFERNFVIYDTDDQVSLIKIIMADKQISPQQFSPRGIHARISSAKNTMVNPEEFASQAQDYFDDKVAVVFPEYQLRLKQNNAMDFDDLLIKPIELFEKYHSVLEHLQQRFKYILVDEYQDTNRAQYLLLKLLASKNRNICVVGDDDQSIYRWRGADIQNILSFEKDYPECAVFRLEQNYRSTKNILAAAHSVISNNRERHDKELWTELDDGELVTEVEADDEVDEALKIVSKIEEELHKGRSEFSDFAILYRTNAQSRALEDGLRSNGISYIIVGGVRFYDRKEVKDVLAYLRVICNPPDSVSLHRIINYPARKIGKATLAKLEQFARQKGISLFKAIGQAKQIEGLSSRVIEKILQFHELIEKYRSLLSELSPGELAASMVEEVGIFRLFKEEGTIEAISRSENVRELLSAISQFSNDVNGKATLEDFLEDVALVSDIDTWDDKSNVVTLMTLHSAKGLEFPVVFIAGLEEGLFPLSRASVDPEELEEERRLFYVGATRAQEKLILLWATGRRRYGEIMSGVVSRFIKEIDPRYLTTEIPHHTQYGRVRRFDKVPAYEDESQEYYELLPGTRVKHQTFGKGIVMSVESYGSDVKVTVAFDTVGRKRLVLSFAKLEIIK